MAAHLFSVRSNGPLVWWMCWWVCPARARQSTAPWVLSSMTLYTWCSREIRLNMSRARSSVGSQWTLVMARCQDPHIRWHNYGSPAMWVFLRSSKGSVVICGAGGRYPAQDCKLVQNKFARYLKPEPELGESWLCSPRVDLVCPNVSWWFL